MKKKAHSVRGLLDDLPLVVLGKRLTLDPHPRKDGERWYVRERLGFRFCVYSFKGKWQGTCFHHESSQLIQKSEWRLSKERAARELDRRLRDFLPLLRRIVK